MRFVQLGFAALLVAGGCFISACSGGGNGNADARKIFDARGPADAGPDAAGPDAAYACPERAPGTTVTLAKNIILVIGDGMGTEHIRAGAIAKGAALGFTQLGFPVLLNTDSLEWDFQGKTTDSAAAATAIATGIRVRNGRVSQSQGTALQHLGELARLDGKAVGMVTTSASYDASTAAFGAHREDRNDDAEIATELISVFKPEVLFGGGSEQFEADSGALLTLATDNSYTVVRTATQLADWDSSGTGLVLGVFSTSIVAPSPFGALFPIFMTPVGRRDGTTTDPLLADMVTRALERLDNDADGFLLVIENEQIDTISHHAAVALETAKVEVPAEVVALDDAVAAAVAWVESNDPDWSETLLLVGADHETGDYSFTGNDLSTGVFPVSPSHSRADVAWYIKGVGASDLSSMCGLPDLFLLMTGQLP